MAGMAFKVIGAIGLASYAMAYVAARMRYVTYVRFKIVAVPVKNLPAMPRGYNWREVSPVELARYTIDIGPRVQAERFAEGLKCIAAFDAQDDLAGVSWLGHSTYHELGITYQLPAGAAWDTGLWVPEERRMSRAFAAVSAAMGECLRQDGFAWTVSTIRDYNIPSILSHRRLGARVLGWCTVLTIGSLQFIYGARPWIRWRGRSARAITKVNVPAAA